MMWTGPRPELWTLPHYHPKGIIWIKLVHSENYQSLRGQQENYDLNAATLFPKVSLKQNINRTRLNLVLYRVSDQKIMIWRKPHITLKYHWNRICTEQDFCKVSNKIMIWMKPHITLNHQKQNSYRTRFLLSFMSQQPNYDLNAAAHYTLKYHWNKIHTERDFSCLLWVNNQIMIWMQPHTTLKYHWNKIHTERDFSCLLWVNNQIMIWMQPHSTLKYHWEKNFIQNEISL